MLHGKKTSGPGIHKQSFELVSHHKRKLISSDELFLCECLNCWFDTDSILQYAMFHKKHSMFQKNQKIKCKTAHLMMLSHFPFNITEHKFSLSAFSHSTYLFLLLKNWLKPTFKHFFFSRKCHSFIEKKGKYVFRFSSIKNNMKHFAFAVK